MGEQLDRFVQHMIESGRYGNASEVIRSALRLLEQQEAYALCGRNFLTKPSWGIIIQNTRSDAELTLCRKQRLHSRFFALVGNAANDIRRGFCFSFPLSHTHNNSHGFGLVGNRSQSMEQCARFTGLTTGSQNIG
ncbi:type II toxin-antitoxin system ParD family antitoxin [Photorhabdus laumondii subsp. laumondii]|uniref:Antitoxin ParD n=1 Tax=Photorhabdus laumondii subsp. laumondii TaxID=141679 RepID=A0A6L9JLK9_PHOLM|nr:type II toxin-antitoxin system ParD family antitoxin [Photorhabdus laumondii subsp. laumondii]NDK94667.1 type II toxin-antitoxin system ParD family antitoxin [Photorhabdus laumondii subsp. laumondii]NDL20970.1 type II toxin-antitoxin system ParD family antitoxin [Photorhabdus laumondii subsp. laumondii]NDL29939.1 type II toxin-antitoxin system ParD family antitoxin [Photorhabdus laumondii subsp. laumondii]NDL33566.1 type II toxin-antitoxin system ParD family antitoxin [Photorhabdus laumondii